MRKKESMSRSIAPEDVRVGMYVAVLHVVSEQTPSCFDFEPFMKAEVRRFVRLPWSASEPLEVVEVCLPFVLVKEPRGKLRTLDVRRYRLAQLSDRYGRRVFGMLKEAAKAKGKRSGVDEDDVE